MNPGSNELVFVRARAAVAAWKFCRTSVGLMLLALGVGFARPGLAQTFEFLQPTNGAVFSTRDEIPIVLRVAVPNDVLVSADVFSAPLQKIGTAVYCCPLCLCAEPQPGQELILRLPEPYQEGRPPGKFWRGWTNVPAREYQLTAKGISGKGTTLQAVPVSITVLDLTLHVNRSPDGTVVLSIAQGSMVGGRYDLEASEDLQEWTVLGTFSPGNVAAFYWDRPPGNLRHRFYRAVWVR